MMASRGGDARPLPKRTREALAACQAVGLHYWADHPQAHHFWAVDDHQQAHAVRVSRRDGTAQHVCRPELLVEACSGDDEAVPYTAPENEDRQHHTPLDHNGDVVTIGIARQILTTTPERR